MSYPVVFQIGQFAVPAHFVFETLSYFIGFRIYLAMRKEARDVVDESTRWTVILAASVGAAIGSKLLHHMASPTRFAEHWPNLAFVMSGKTIVGGLLGGLLGVEAVKKYYGIKESTGDLFAIPLCLAMAIGRVGCFLSGIADDTVGIHTSLPWAVDFGDGPRHPTPLYEIAYLLLLATFIWRKKKSGHGEGQLFSIFMFGYLSFRFLCDFIKPYEVIMGLKGIQWACLMGIVHYTRKLAFARKPISEDFHHD